MTAEGAAIGLFVALLAMVCLTVHLATDLACARRVIRRMVTEQQDTREATRVGVHVHLGDRAPGFWQSDDGSGCDRFFFGPPLRVPTVPGPTPEEADRIFERIIQHLRDDTEDGPR